MLIQRLKMDKYVNSDLMKFKDRAQVAFDNGGQEPPLSQRLKIWWKDGMDITKKIFPYVLLGVAIGAFIHGYIPQSFIQRYLGMRTWWAIPAATLLGVPWYANSVSVIPIMQALVGKGVPVGTALTFMTSVVTISIPEALILKKAMKWQLLAMFFGVTIIGIMIMGYILNLVI